MANPQQENGHIRIANDVWDALIKIRVPGEAMQVLLFIIRKTWGFGKKEDFISLSQFCLATGIRKRNIIRGLAKLSQINIISVVQKDTTLLRLYRFNKDFDTWKPLSKRTLVSKRTTGGVQKDNKVVSKRTPTITNITNTTKTNGGEVSPQEEISKPKPVKPTYPREHYIQVCKSYQTIKDVKPQGNEWLPIQKEIKLMFDNGRSPAEIIEAMEVVNELYPDWSMSTVRMKIADVASGKLKSKITHGSRFIFNNQTP